MLLCHKFNVLRRCTVRVVRTADDLYLNIPKTLTKLASNSFSQWKLLNIYEVLLINRKLFRFKFQKLLMDANNDFWHLRGVSYPQSRIHNPVSKMQLYEWKCSVCHFCTVILYVTRDPNLYFWYIIEIKFKEKLKNFQPQRKTEFVYYA